MARRKRKGPIRTAVSTARDRMLAEGVHLLLWLGLRLPYRQRVLWLSWIGGRVIAPLAGYRRVIRRNLALVRPDLPRPEVERIARRVPEMATRVLIETFSGEEFRAHARAAPMHGAEGLAAIAEARAAGRGVVMVSGHFGNYEVPRAAFAARGWPVGGLYRPMSNAAFNPRYVAAIAAISGPVFPRDRRGLGEMVRHLRSGGIIGLLIDQRMRHGAPLTFFGHTAWTALSAAELAVKYDALIVPAYGVRQPDGLNFEVVVEPPVPHGEPAAMTQALNDSLEAQVRTRMDQWMWFHDRWKGVRRRPEEGPRPDNDANARKSIPRPRTEAGPKDGAVTGSRGPDDESPASPTARQAG